MSEISNIEEMMLGVFTTHKYINIHVFTYFYYIFIFQTKKKKKLYVCINYVNLKQKKIFKLQ